MCKKARSHKKKTCARPDLNEDPKYKMGKDPGFEIHPVESGYSYNLPHIKWQD